MKFYKIKKNIDIKVEGTEKPFSLKKDWIVYQFDDHNLGFKGTVTCTLNHNGTEPFFAVPKEFLEDEYEYAGN